jgi:hypothetical protein
LLRISSVAVSIENGATRLLGGLKTMLTTSDPPAGIVSGSVGAVRNANIDASAPTILSPSDGIDSGAVPVLRMTTCSGGLLEPPRGSLNSTLVCATSMVPPGGIGRSSVIRRAPVSFSSYSET